MLAFSPGTIVPGIYYSNDKMFQTRIFAYGDTQRHRLGPNFLQLPVNAPKCPKHNNHHEGFMNFMHRDEEVSGFYSTDQCTRAVVSLMTESPCFNVADSIPDGGVMIWIAGELLPISPRPCSCIGENAHFSGHRLRQEREGNARVWMCNFSLNPKRPLTPVTEYLWSLCIPTIYSVGFDQSPRLILRIMAAHLKR